MASSIVDLCIFSEFSSSPAKLLDACLNVILNTQGVSSDIYFLPFKEKQFGSTEYLAWQMHTIYLWIKSLREWASYLYYRDLVNTKWWLSPITFFNIPGEDVDLRCLI